MSAHARLGPSNHRWPHCPGSVREEARYPDIPGEAAIDGTGSHILLEMCLENGVAAAQYDQQIIGVNHHDNPNGWLVSTDRIDRVQMCLNYVTRRVTELNEQFENAVVTVQSESKSDPGGMFGRSDWWGTVDITITARHKMTGDVLFVEVCDYKDGRGYVNLKDPVYDVNTQLLSYLAGKLRPFIASGPEKVRPLVIPARAPGIRCSIVQPKTNPVIRYLCSTQGDISIEQIVDVLDLELSAAAHRTDLVDAPLVPGKHCQWCKANPKRGGHCTAETDKSLTVVSTMNNQSIIATSGQSIFEIIGNAVADPKSLSVEQLAELADARDGLMSAFDKVNEEIEARIASGEKVPGYQMQPSRSSRVWGEDQETVAKKLKSLRLKKDDIFPPALISPAQFMKLEQITPEQKERISKQLIVEKSGKLKLTKVSRDQQDRVEKDVNAMFEGVAQSSTNAVQSESQEPPADISFL